MEYDIVLNSNKKIIPVRIAKISKDDDSVTAVTRFQDAIAVDDIRQRLEDYQSEYKAMVNAIDSILNDTKKSAKTSVLTYWKIGDMIYSFLQKAVDSGMALTNYERTLARDLRVSPSRIFYFLHFREMHPSLKDVNPSIPWTWYVELTMVKDHNLLRNIEKDILGGKIESLADLKRIVRS